MENIEFLPEHQWIKDVNYRAITTKEEWQKWSSGIDGVLSFDTETQGLNPNTHKVVGMSFSYKEGDAVYVPLNHPEGNFEDEEWFVESLQEIFSNNNILMYNAKFDLEFVEKNYGLQIPKFEDVMVSFFLGHTEEKSKGLKNATTVLVDLQQIELKELFDRNGLYYSFSEEKPPKVADMNFGLLNLTPYAIAYASADADMTLRVYNRTEQIRQENLVIYKIESRLVKLVMEMEENRIMLDADYYCRLCRHIYQEVLKLEKKIYELAGKEFSLTSSVQVAHILMDVLGLELPKTGKGNYSSTEKELIPLIDKHPIIEELLTFRSYTKALNGYLTKLYMGGLMDTGVKFKFNPLSADTGRFSSSGDGDAVDSQYIAVNAQNITSNKEARWFKARQILERRLKETGELCYKYEPQRLSEEELSDYDNFKERYKKYKKSEVLGIESK